MDSTQQYRANLEDWIAHCDTPKVKYQSSLRAYIDCDGYRGLVEKGVDIFPQLLESMKKEEIPFIGWASLVGEIAGDEFTIPTDIQGSVESIYAFTTSWLETYLDGC